MDYLQEMMYRRAEAEYERARDEASCSCEPTVIKAEQEYEPDGYSMDYTYNCHICDNRECEYWSDYNDDDNEEMTLQEIKDMCKKYNLKGQILDPDWAEFFNATCERYRKG